MSQNQETRGFQSEVKQLLQLMIHSLYSNKEIFLRELISNASDAADKLRFKALSNPALYEGDGDLRVRVSFDADKGIITISDNGIGMTREQVIDHLGTIAKSGTKEFLTALGQDQAKKIASLLGNLAWVFILLFIVADKVTVKPERLVKRRIKLYFGNLRAKANILWRILRKKSRGTDVILHLREDEKRIFK